MSRESFSIEELMRYLREATVTELHARFWTLIRGSEVLLTPYGVVLAHSHHIEEGSWFLLLFSGEKFGRHLVVGGSTAGIYGVDNSADVSELLKVFEYLIRTTVEPKAVREALWRSADVIRSLSSKAA